MSRHIYACQNGCPIESTMQIISGKWKCIIIYHLLEENTCHFGTLKKEMQDCSKRMLALQLSELENDGIIKKTVYPVIPPKTDYTLTEFGKTLGPVVKAMETWGNYYNQLNSVSSSTDLNDCRTPINQEELNA